MNLLKVIYDEKTVANALYENAFCDLRGQSCNKINFRSGGWRNVHLFPAANDLSISDNNMGSIDEPGEDSGTTFQRLEIYLSNINVEKIFLIADNSGLIVIWKTYYHGTSYIIPETSTQSTKRTHICLLPFFSYFDRVSLSFLQIIFFLFSLSFLLLTYRFRRRVYTISFLMIIQIECAEELFI